MAKSTTMVRDDKQGTQPEKSMIKAKARQVSEPGQDELRSRETSSPGCFRDQWTSCKEMRSEMRKVSVPSREEVRTTTTVVIVTVFAFAAYFYVVDAVFKRAAQSLLRWLGGIQ